MSVQEFFLTMLNPAVRYTNCSHCFTKCDALIPCPFCQMVCFLYLFVSRLSSKIVSLLICVREPLSHVNFFSVSVNDSSLLLLQMMYCSEDCLVSAFNSYHCIECYLGFDEVPHFFHPLHNEATDSRNEIASTMRTAVRALLIGTHQGHGLEALMMNLGTVENIFVENVDRRNGANLNDYVAALRIRRTFDKGLPEMKELVEQTVKMVFQLKCLPAHRSFFKSPTARLFKEYAIPVSFIRARYSGV